ncbi:MAG: hypothetical protein OEM51_00205 [Gammaproteobacteria bacterium]|nr:hypothetical protein [Gammaproteobacteria bacterium]MDH3431234.1 hypothetical protein [Gammaproteobacteria bacterium]
MSQVRIVEQNYFEFTAALRAAADSGDRIEPREKDRWKEFVKEHRIQEAAFKSLADKKYEGMQPVIIADSSPWQGYYLYTTAEEAVLKWVRE